MIKNKHEGYEVVPFPKMRRLVMNMGRMARRKHTIRGLVEIDVTRARQYLRQQKIRTGESFSFTAFILACVGRAVDENKHVHAYRNWRGQLMLFDEVDGGIMVERESGDQKIPVVHIVRGANTKTFRDIHEEIRAIQAKPMSGGEVQAVQSLRVLPGFVRQIFLWLVSKNPHLVKQNMGTVALTAIGMFGNRGGWGIDAPIHTLGIVVGGIAERPAIVDGRIENREYLSVTLDFDHDLIDGAPAARFAQRLCELIESSYGLYDSESQGHIVAQ